MASILELQELAADKNDHRSPSTNSNWLCYSNTSWLFC
ncbi:SapB/AmfS family lanthipeptide [Luteococcus sp.]